MLYKVRVSLKFISGWDRKISAPYFVRLAIAKSEATKQSHDPGQIMDKAGPLQEVRLLLNKKRLSASKRTASFISIYFNLFLISIYS
jgi:hypothetical protein